MRLAEPEAIVLDFYNGLQADFDARVHEAIAAHKSLVARLQAVFEIRLDDHARHREIFVALSRVALDPSNPLAVFSEQTLGIRDAAMATMRAVVEHPDVPQDMRDLVASAMWLFMMALVAIDLFDPSREQARARLLTTMMAHGLPTLLTMLARDEAAVARTMISTALTALGLAIPSARKGDD